MKIRELKLKGWRSYSDDEEGVLQDLKKINIIIGPNNSGKSNIFKYLFHLREMARNTKESTNPKRINYELYNNINHSFPKEDSWAFSSCDIVSEIKLEEIPVFVNQEKVPSLHNEVSNIILSAYHNTKEKRSCLSVKYEDKFLLEPFVSNPKIIDRTTKEYISPREEHDFFYDTYLYWDNFLNSLVFVDPIRHYARSSSAKKESDFDGSEIVSEIIRMRDREDQWWIVFKETMQGWLTDLLSEKNFEIEPTSNELRFYIQRGNNKISAFLSQLGTGVSQLVMLLSFLFLNKERVLNVFIEEPEGNLHPEAVVQLVKILKNNFNNHRFFISTHSSILMDQLDEDWTVHRVIRKKEQSSIMIPCTEVVQKYEVLDELGIRASQLLQSNLVIWVEGPSDRIYLNKWIQDHAPYLIEGKHYSFVMYGGTNLSSIDILSDEHDIDILYLSRYAIIVCDSDKDSEEDTLKERVRKLLSRYEKYSQIEIGHERKISDYVMLWITKGREIENYIPHNLFATVLSNEKFLRKYVLIDKNGKKEKENIIFKPDLGETFGQYDRFNEYFAARYFFTDGTPLSTQNKESIASSLNKKKTHIAKSIVEAWTMEHYCNLDLKERINEALELIKRANYL